MIGEKGAVFKYKVKIRGKNWGQNKLNTLSGRNVFMSQPQDMITFSANFPENDKFI